MKLEPKLEPFFQGYRMLSQLNQLLMAYCQVMIEHVSPTGFLIRPGRIMHGTDPGTLAVPGFFHAGFAWMTVRASELQRIRCLVSGFADRRGTVHRIQYRGRRGGCRLGRGPGIVCAVQGGNLLCMQSLGPIM